MNGMQNNKTKTTNAILFITLLHTHAFYDGYLVTCNYRYE